MEKVDILKQDAIELLKQMIETPSFSREEKEVADLIEQFLQVRNVNTHRLMNNIYAFNQHFDSSKQTYLFNSHHDTVKPAAGYTVDPFKATLIDDKLIGLGSNDAGGPLVSLIATFLYFHDATDLPFNLVLTATAEEEISGKNGIELLLKDETFMSNLRGSQITGGLVGEPTKMEMAVAEKGLIVLDAVANGKAGHAARNEGVNAIDIALADIMEIKKMSFDKHSELTGASKATVTVIETENKAHNVVPASCKFVIDIRVNELYTFEEIIEDMQSKVKSQLTPRSFRMRSTMIPMDHPIVQAGLELGRPYYGSPTTSDKALMYFPALKIGPGDSARSHTADEYILLDEIRNGIDGYIQLIKTSVQIIQAN
jgi:acetylornithine deacetylase